ncbi:hypothetical protein [Virgibacillus salexigens]|uniref:hypothetical protein n=1 Tax=Virgibacillus salexigens TaxID=61016 RepID=UPI00190A7411|nr:hypothetical protein [Virgibacillus salexigens]
MYDLRGNWVLNYTKIKNTLSNDRVFYREHFTIDSFAVDTVVQVVEFVAIVEPRLFHVAPLTAVYLAVIVLVEVAEHSAALVALIVEQFEQFVEVIVGLVVVA